MFVVIKWEHFSFFLYVVEVSELRNEIFFSEYLLQRFEDIILSEKLTSKIGMLLCICLTIY